MSLPVVMAAAGPQPQSPASLNAQIIAAATAANPGLATNLPGTLIEDIVSTDTGALVLIDQAQVETINSLTPHGANLFILGKLGEIYGVKQGVLHNTSVYVMFSGYAGVVIPSGMIVSDGTYQYQTQDVGVVSSTGFSSLMYCVATIAGTWAIPEFSVTTIVSSTPANSLLTVFNPHEGIPGTTEESPETYRARVLAAGLVTATGMNAMVKSALKAAGANRVSVIQNTHYTPSRWEILIDTGDPYVLATAIYQTCGDINSLTGSSILVTGITAASNALVTTDLYHGYTSATFTGAILLNFLTVSAISGGSIAVGDHVIGTCPAGTVITAISSINADGTGTYNVNNSGTYTATGSATQVTVTGVVGTMATAMNGVPFLATVASNHTFTTGINTTGLAWTSGGVCLPNSRNQAVSIIDIPDTYSVPFVISPVQAVNINITWNTTATNIISGSSVSQLGIPAIIDYVNTLGMGEPINTFEMTAVLSDALSTIIPPNQLSRLVFAVYINGEAVAPNAGTGAIYGDREGYFSARSIVLTKG